MKSKRDKQLKAIGEDYAYELLQKGLTYEQMLDEAGDGCYELATGKHKVRDADVIYQGIIEILNRN